MTNHRLLTLALSMSAAVAFANTPLAWSADIEPLVRVRSNSPSIAAAIEEAEARSALFRRLIGRIDATDGLVYVDEGKCGHGVRACLTLSVQVAGPYRLLRIFVEPQKNLTCGLMASIGHELWHAIELLSEPNVRDYRTAYSFFQRTGPRGGGHNAFETAAAVRVGFDVHNEVCRRAWMRTE